MIPILALGENVIPRGEIRRFLCTAARRRDRSLRLSEPVWISSSWVIVCKVGRLAVE